MVINTEGIQIDRIDADIRMLENAREFSKNGKWFCDTNGRYLIFRGVNFGSRAKSFPYLPIAPIKITHFDESDLEKEIESVKKEIGLLKKIGNNVVRLLVMWKALEPYPNNNLDELLPDGRKYLSLVKKIIDLLYQNDQYIILDFHQDIVHELFGGDGFPDWAIAVNSKLKRPEPASMRDKKWQIKYMTNKLLRHTLESFWNNDLTNDEMNLQNYPVRTHLEKTIGQTVKYFKLLNDGKGHPAILGVESFNEPHPAGIDKQHFEKELLYQYYINVNNEIRKYDDKLFLFMEPRVDWTVSSTEVKKSAFGGPVKLKNLFNLNFIRDAVVDSKINPKTINTFLPSDHQSFSNLKQRGVLSFHYYDTMAIAGSFLKVPENLVQIKREWPDIFSQLVKAASTLDLIPFLTEFGGLQENEQIKEYLDLSFKQIETFLLNSIIWNFDLYNTLDGKDNWNLENYSILGPNRVPRNFDVIARPYPMQSSAEPQFLSFDLKTKQTLIVLEGKLTCKDKPTIIFVPYEIHYSPEFVVWATSKELKWDKQNQVLHWYPDTDETTNFLIIGKSNEIFQKALPENMKKLLEEKNLYQKKFS